MSINMFLDDIDEGGGTTFIMYPILGSENVTTVYIEDYITDIITYAESIVDTDMTLLKLKVSYNRNERTNMYLESTLQWFDKPTYCFNDYMAIGWPDDLDPQFDTLIWEKSVNYEFNYENYTYNESGNYSQALANQRMSYDEGEDSEGIIWKVKLYNLGDLYGLHYPDIFVEPYYQTEYPYEYVDDELLPLEINHMEFKISTNLATHRTDDYFDSFNMILWSDYKHIYLHFNLTPRLVLEVLLAESTGTMSLAIYDSFELSADNSRRVIIQISYIE